MIKLICFEIKKFFRRPKNIISILMFCVLICAYIFFNNSAEKRFVKGEFETAKENLQTNQKLIKESKIILKKEYIKRLEEVIINDEKFVSLLERKCSAISKKDWKEQLKVDILLDEHKIKNIKTEGVISSESIEDVEKRMNKSKFLLKNNIKPICEFYSMSSYNFMKKVYVEILMIIVLVIVILSSDIISLESDEGTFKILLIQPISRTKVILSKIISITIICISIMAIVFGMFFIILGLTKGFGNPNYPVEILINNKIKIIGIRKFILTTIPLQILSIIFIVSLGVLISTLIQSSISSIGVSMLITITMYIFNNELKLFENLSHVLPFSYMNAADVVSGNTMTIFNNKNINYLSAVITLATYSLIFYIISIVVFRKRDIQC